jgi:uncharacterized membrane protein
LFLTGCTQTVPSSGVVNESGVVKTDAGSYRGSVREWTLNPLWVRLERVAHEEFGIERLFLISHGRRLSIAACLGPDEKASFAGALSTALSEAKRGPKRTVP